MVFPMLKITRPISIWLGIIISYIHELKIILLILLVVRIKV